jgi:hypothetical protein
VSFTTSKLGRYTAIIVATNNECTANDAMNQDWGFFHSVFTHPFLSCLRPLAYNSSYSLPRALEILGEAADQAIPDYMHGVPVFSFSLSHNGTSGDCPQIAESTPAKKPTSQPEDTDEDSLQSSPSDKILRDAR